MNWAGKDLPCLALEAALPSFQESLQWMWGLKILSNSTATQKNHNGVLEESSRCVHTHFLQD